MHSPKSIAVIAVCLLLALPGFSDFLPLAQAATPFSAPSIMTDANGTVFVNLSVSPSHVDLSSTFWGTTVSPRSRILPDEGTLINATPSQVIVWPGGQAGDEYDPLANLIYSQSGASTTPVTSEADFVSWCKSINCSAIIQIPAEIDDPAIALEVVQYTILTLNFTPTYWEFGNEPELWTHYGQAWSSWASSYPSRINPSEYADLISTLISAIRPQFPTIKFIGIAATGRPNQRGPIQNWIAPLVAVDGEELSAVAYHDYPAAGGATKTGLAAFYGAINGTAGLSGVQGRVAQVEAGIATGAAESTNLTCQEECSSSIRVFVTEVGSGLSHSYWSPWAASFPGALDLAAQVTQAMDLNLTNQDLFSSVANTVNSWFNLTGFVRPDYTLYSEILNHLGSEAFETSLTTPASCGCDQYNTSLGSQLYGVATVDPADHGRSDLMIVNLNLSTSVAIDPELPGVLSTTPAEVWTWSGNLSEPGYFTQTTPSALDPATPNPVAQYYPSGLPQSWQLPPQSVALFEAFPLGGAAIQFHASGFLNNSQPPRWEVSVGGRLYTVNDSANLTVLAPSGISVLSSPPIPLNNGSALTAGNNELKPKERLEPYLPSRVTVSSIPLEVNVSFAHQWWANLTSTPSAGGYISPEIEWMNASVPTAVTARASFHYVFTHWVGFGLGSYNGTSETATLNLSSWIAEKAEFAYAYPVAFQAIGLPSGTNWSVTVRTNFGVSGTSPQFTTLSSSTSTIVDVLPNGTFAYEVGPEPGFRELPQNGSFDVAGRYSFVNVTFEQVHPPAERYDVLFEESGLPNGTGWWLGATIVSSSQSGNSTTVELSRVIEYSTAASILIQDPNGTFGYNTSSVPGYLPHPLDGAFQVNGSDLIIVLNFAPVVYPVIWKEAGLGPNLSWSVVVENQHFPNHGSWTTALLPNGTYRYSVPQVLDYVPSLVTNAFTINGSSMEFAFSFAEARFLIEFVVSDFLAGWTWQARLSNTTISSSASTVAFTMANGSYTFDIVPPSGYFVQPSHGTVLVNASTQRVLLSFESNKPTPIPPLWDLALPALFVATATGLAGAATYIFAAYARRRGRERSD